MKKSLKMRLLCGVLFVSAFVSAAFASCAEKPKETEKSALRGTFTYQGSRSVFFSSDRTTSDALYLDTAIYAGFDTFLNGGAYCNYKVDLKLKLSNDYSSIQLVRRHGRRERIERFLQDDRFGFGNVFLR